MDRLRSWILEFRNDEKAVRNLYTFTLVAALFAASIVIKSGIENGKYIIGEEGTVVGIERRSLKKLEEYPFTVEIHSKDGVIRKEVTLSGKIPDETKKTEEKSDRDAAKEERRISEEMEVDQILRSLGESKERRVMLPDELSDGSRLKWIKRGRKNDDVRIVGILYLAAISIVIYSHCTKGKKSFDTERQAIIQGLPRFVNQLVMLMNAGIILSDAFDRICQSYLLIPEDRRSAFEKRLVQLSEQNPDHRVSTAMLINEFARECNVKELLRITTILIENERRGSDVIENLTRESEFLWEERKIMASERGKMIDAKMAYPMGLLLVTLIVITMTPAILTM